MAKKDIVHSPIDNLTFTFEVPGRTIIALYNAVGFTMAHRELYNKEFDNCDSCFDGMAAMNNYLWNLISTAGGSEILKKELN